MTDNKEQPEGVICTLPTNFKNFVDTRTEIQRLEHEKSAQQVETFVGVVSKSVLFEFKMGRVKGFLPSLSQLEAARDFEIKLAGDNVDLVEEAKKRFDKKTKSLESITNTIADHVVRCSEQRNKILDIFTNIQKAGNSVGQMWTTMAIQDPMSDKSLELAIREFVPDVEKQAQALDDLALMVKADNAKELAEIEKDLKDLTITGSKRV